MAKKIDPFQAALERALEAVHDRRRDAQLPAELMHVLDDDIRLAVKVALETVGAQATS